MMAPRSLRSLPPAGALMSSLRNHARRDGLAVQRDRLRIAQAAARLIAEHGLTDWTLAKRKAVRQLLLPDASGAALQRRDRSRADRSPRAFRRRRPCADAARAADRGARVDASARAVGSGPGRGRRGGMGHRAQRRPPRACRRRSEGGGNRSRWRAASPTPRCRRVTTTRPRICASNRRGPPCGSRSSRRCSAETARAATKSRA